MKRYWGTQRVARVCQGSPATVANWIDQGLLKGHKTPTGRRRVDADDLAAFLRAHAMAVPPELEHSNGHDVVVVEATNGVDGLLEIGRAQPSVILLDYTLPDLNATQVLERLLEPGRRVDAEVIVVTGGLPSDALAELQRVGVKAIVSKADGVPAVVDAMRQALERWKAA